MDNIIPFQTFSDEIKDDLGRSAIDIRYAVEIMRIRPAQADPINQYVIPYFNLDGTEIHNYWRIKLLPKAQSKYTADPPKYLSPPESTNHLYIPPNFRTNFKRNNQFLIITEGEKKCASLNRLGFAAIGIAGINSWQTGTLTIKATIENLTDVIKNPKDEQTIRFKSSQSIVEGIQDIVCPEFDQIFNMINSLQISKPKIYIIFDRDPENKVKTIENTANALFEFSLFLNKHGFEEVQSIHLPIPPAYKDNFTNTQIHKVGIDDVIYAILQANSNEATINYIHEILRSTEFSKKPVPHNIFNWVQKQMNLKTHNRDDKRRIAKAIINHLDNLGSRYYDRQKSTFYYLINDTKEVHEFDLSHQTLRDFYQTSFGQLLSQLFGIDSHDTDLLGRLANFYTSYGSTAITPRRSSYSTTNPTTNSSCLYIQLTNSQLLKCTSTSFDIVDNGTDGQLFISNLTKPLNTKVLNDYLLNNDTDARPNWFETLESTTLQAIPPFTLQETYAFVGCLFYLNPWFRRFRGLQLPIEMAIGEPGSGKSFLYKLRQGILTGYPREQSVPQQIRDWYTSISNGSDFWVGDNTGNLAKDTKAVLPDELCRIVTSEDPTITVRQLYTTNSIARLEVPCTFAFTAINNPFTAEDFIQRSIFLNFQAHDRNEADWVNNKLLPREKWIAHLVKVSQYFFTQTDNHFNPKYKSNHRLMHFEQLIIQMGRALQNLLKTAIDADTYPTITYKYQLQFTALETMIQKIQSNNNTINTISTAPTTQQQQKQRSALEQIQSSNVEENQPILQALKRFSSTHQHTTKPYLFTITQFQAWISTNYYYEYQHIALLENNIQLGKYITSHANDVRKITGITKLNKQLKGSTGYQICPESEFKIDKE